MSYVTAYSSNLSCVRFLWSFSVVVLGQSVRQIYFFTFYITYIYIYEPLFDVAVVKQRREMHDSSAAHHDNTSNLYSRAPERCLRLQLLPGQKPARVENNFMQNHFADKEPEVAYISEPFK